MYLLNNGVHSEGPTAGKGTLFFIGSFRLMLYSTSPFSCPLPLAFHPTNFLPPPPNRITTFPLPIRNCKAISALWHTHTPVYRTNASPASTSVLSIASNLQRSNFLKSAKTYRTSKNLSHGHMNGGTANFRWKLFLIELVS